MERSMTREEIAYFGGSGIDEQIACKVVDGRVLLVMVIVVVFGITSILSKIISWGKGRWGMNRKKQKQIEEKVIALIIENLGVKPEDVTMKAALEGDLGADSLGYIDLVLCLEHEFGITIPDEEVEDIKTVKDIIQAITRKVGEK